jgi:hypothetical protein
VLGSPSELPPGHAEAAVAVVDLDPVPSEDAGAHVAEVAAACPAARLVVTAGFDARRRLVSALAHPAVRHAMPKAPLFVEDAAAPMFLGPDERDLYVALRRAEASDPPSQAAGVAPYLASVAVAQEVAVTGSEERDTAVVAVVELGLKMRLHDEKLRRIEVVTEELIENAIYDAPVDPGGPGGPSGPGGPRRFAERPRSEPVALGPGERVRVRWGCDGRSFAVAVLDPFGSLDASTLVGHLGQVLAPDGVRTSGGPGGAGIGLVMTYGAANQLAFELWPGRATEVVAVVDVAGTNRASLVRGTAVHLYAR